LTIVQPPDEVQEQDRDLLRSRQKVMQQRTHLRKHLQAVLRRNGLHYKAETGNKSHWTKHHYCWLTPHRWFIGQSQGEPGLAVATAHGA
jgi:hypothetical protein